MKKEQFYILFNSGLGFDCFLRDMLFSKIRNHQNQLSKPTYVAHINQLLTLENEIKKHWQMENTTSNYIHCFCVYNFSTIDNIQIDIKLVLFYLSFFVYIYLLYCNDTQYLYILIRSRQIYVDKSIIQFIYLFICIMHNIISYAQRTC